MHVNVTRTLNLSQISLLLAISFHALFSAAIFETAVVGFTLSYWFFRCSDIKNREPCAKVELKLRIGFFIFRTKRKKNRVQKKKKKKKIGRKTAIKFSESARFLTVGRARSNKYLFIFGLSHVVRVCCLIVSIPDICLLSFLLSEQGF